MKFDNEQRETLIVAPLNQNGEKPEEATGDFGTRGLGANSRINPLIARAQEESASGDFAFSFGIMAEALTPKVPGHTFPVNRPLIFGATRGVPAGLRPARVGV